MNCGSARRVLRRITQNQRRDGSGGHAGPCGLRLRISRGERGSGRILVHSPAASGGEVVGTADVLRQVAVLNALDGTDVPHCSVKWSGDDTRGLARRILSCHGSRAM